MRNEIKIRFQRGTPEEEILVGKLQAKIQQQVEPPVGNFDASTDSCFDLELPGGITVKNVVLIQSLTVGPSGTPGTENFYLFGEVELITNPYRMHRGN